MAKKPMPIHDMANDRWTILMPDGYILTWGTEPWRTAMLAFTRGPKTITQDEDGVQLSNVTFPTKEAAEFGIFVLRTFEQADRKVTQYAEALYGSRG